MSRLFFCDYDKKIHSFQFPFTLRIESEGNKVYYRDKEITSDLLSGLVIFFESLSNKKDIYSVSEDILVEIEHYGIEKEILNDIIWHLLLFEPGYIRYDYDTSERSKKPNHPENHFDVYYENKNTVKLGLNKKID